MLIIVSIFCSGLSFFTIETVPGIQEHPMKIIQWVQASTFSFMWTLLLAKYSCDIGLNKLWMYSLPMLNSTDEEQATNVLYHLSIFWITFFYSCIIMFNMALSVDLLLTIRNPFQKPERRYPLYLTTSFLVSLVPSIVRTVDTRYRYDYGMIIDLIFALYFIVTVSNIVHAVYYLCRPGISRDMIKLIVYRHVFYILINLLCQIYAVSGFVINSVE